MPKISIPDVGAVQFPDDMSREEVQSGVKRVYLQGQQRKAAAAGTGAAGLASKLHDGIYRGLETPERMIRNLGDVTGYYKGLDYLFDTGDRFQKYNQEALGNMRRWEKERRQFNEQIGANTFAGEVVQGVGKAVAELPMQILPAMKAASTAQAVKASAAIAGTQSGLETYGGQRGEGQGRGYAAVRGLEAAIITAMTTKAFGASGVEAVFRKSGAKGVANKLKEMFKQGGLEASEEVLDEFQQDLAGRYHEDPTKPIADTVHELLLAGTVGGLVGGMVTAAQEFRGERSPQPAPQLPPRPPVPVDDNVIRDPDGQEMIRLPIEHPEGGQPVGDMAGDAFPVYANEEPGTKNEARPVPPQRSAPRTGRPTVGRTAEGPGETTPQTPSPPPRPAEHPEGGEPIGDPGSNTFPLPDSVRKELEKLQALEGTAPSAPPATTYPELQQIWEDYDNPVGDGFVTVADVVNQVEALLDQGLAPRSLQPVIETHRKQSKADFEEFAGRGDVDDEAVLNAISKIVAHPDSPPAAEAAGTADVVLDLRPIEQAATEDELYRIGGAMIQSANGDAEVQAIQQAMQAWSPKPLSPETITGSNEQVMGSEMPVPTPPESAGESASPSGPAAMQAYMEHRTNKKILKEGKWPNGQKVTPAERKEIQQVNRRLKKAYPGNIEKDSPFKSGLAGGPKATRGADKAENSTSETPAPDSVRKELEKLATPEDSSAVEGSVWDPAGDPESAWMADAIDHLQGGRGKEAAQTLLAKGKDNAVQFATDWLGWKVRKTKWKEDLKNQTTHYVQFGRVADLEGQLNGLTNKRLKEIGREIGLGKMNFGVKADRVGKILHWFRRTTERYAETNTHIGASQVVRGRFDAQAPINKAELSAGRWKPESLFKAGYDETETGDFVWTGEAVGADGLRSGQRANKVKSARAMLEQFDADTARLQAEATPDLARLLEIRKGLRENMATRLQSLEQAQPAPNFKAVGGNRPTRQPDSRNAARERELLARFVVEKVGDGWRLTDQATGQSIADFTRKADAVRAQYVQVDQKLEGDPKATLGADKSENSTSETPAPESAPTKKKRASDKGKRKPADRPVFGDALDDIEEHGGMMSASRARKLWGTAKFKANASNWEDAPTLPPGHNFIYSATATLAPDEMLKALREDENHGAKYAGMEVPDLWAQIAADSRERTATTKARKREEKWLREDAQQATNFYKAAADGKIEVRGTELRVGDAIEIEGTPLEVTDIDADSGDVTLENGQRFGTQRIAEDQTIYVEKLEQDVSTDFLEGEDAAAAEPDPISEPAPTKEAPPLPATAAASIGRHYGSTTGFWNTLHAIYGPRQAEQSYEEKRGRSYEEDVADKPEILRNVEAKAQAEGWDMAAVLAEAQQQAGYNHLWMDAQEIAQVTGNKLNSLKVMGQVELTEDVAVKITSSSLPNQFHAQVTENGEREYLHPEPVSHTEASALATAYVQDFYAVGGATPKPADDFNLEMHDDDSLQAEKDKVAAQQEQRAAEEEAARRQSAPLEGDTGNLGQGDIFGNTKQEGVGTDDTDLFAPPSPTAKEGPVVEAAEAGDTIHFQQGDGREYQADVRNVIEPNATVNEVQYGVDNFGYKLIPASRVVRVDKSTRRLNREKLEAAKAKPNPGKDGPQAGIKYGRAWIKTKLMTGLGKYGLYDGPNWYRTGAKRMAEAVDKGIPFELHPVEQSSYGAKVELVIGGERIPLTKGKLRKNDFRMYFGGHLPPKGSSSKYSAAQKYPGGDLGGRSGPLPVADDPEHTVFPLQMPELLKIAVALGQGKFPKLKDLLKRGALGLFQGKAGKPNSGRMALDRTLWQLVTESERAELRARAIELEPDDRREQQRIYQELYEELYEEKLRSEPERAVKVLAHELMHWIDFLPQGMIDGRGNIFGRVAKLKNYLKHTLPWDPYAGLTGFLRQPTKVDRDKLRRQAEKELRAEMGPIREVVKTVVLEEPIYETVGVAAEDIKALFGMSAREDMPELYVWFARLDDQTKKEVVKQAMKGVVDARAPGTKKKTGTKKTERTVREKVGREPTKEEIRERFRKNLREVLERLRRMDLQETKQQLEGAIAWWRGTDQVEDYFRSSEEMFAESGSIFLANPAALAKRAPNYFKALINYLDRNPAVSQLYDEIQRDIENGAIDDQRSVDLREGWRRQEERAIKQQSSGRWTITRAIDSLVAQLDRALGPIYRRGRGSKREGDLRARLGMMNYRGGPAESFVNAVDVDVSRYLVTHNLNWEDFGEYLFHKRVTEHYDEKAVPLGYSPATSNDALAALQARLGAVRFAALEEAQRRFRKIYEEDVVALAAQTGLLDDQLRQVMMDNVYYSTWEAVKDAPKTVMEELLDKRFGNGVSAHVYRRVGNLGEIKNPATATINKALAIISAAHRNNAKRILPGVLEEMGYPVQEVKKTWDPGRKALVYDLSPEAPGSPVQKLVFLDDGKIRAVYVEKEVAEGFNSGSPIEGDIVAQALRAVTRWQKQMFTGWNYGFWPVMTVRDVVGFGAQMPGVAAPFHYVKNLPQAVKASVDSYRGRRNPHAEEALKRGLWISRSEPVGFAAASDNEFELKTARMGLTPGTWSQRGWREWAGKAWEAYLSIGKILERSHKINGMMYLDKKYPNMPEWEKAEAVREWAGSPDFLQQPSHRGKFDLVTNVFLMFYNPWKESIRSVAKAAKKHPGSFTVKAAVGVVMPAIIQGLAALGWMGDDWEEALASVSDYDLQNYLIIPLGWDDYENKKLHYMRIPLWEPARLMHGLMTQQITGRGEKAGMVFGSQVPTLNPLLEVGLAWAKWWAGANHKDLHSGFEVVDPDVWEGDEGRRKWEMLKWSWNKMGGRAIYEFPRQNLHDNPTDREKFLRKPVVSNSMGRLWKVSNRGLFDRDRRLLDEPEQKRRAKARLSVDEMIRKLLNQEKLTAAERTQLVLDPYALQYLAEKFPTTAGRKSSLLYDRLKRVQTKEARDAILREEVANLYRSIPQADGAIQIAP